MLPNTCFLTQYRCLTSSPAFMQGIPTAAHDVLCAQLRWVSAADRLTARFTSQMLRARPALKLRFTAALPTALDRASIH